MIRNLIHEIPPLKEEDSYYPQERYKDTFNYPLHNHGTFELNFVENCEGARRIVGDNMEVTGNYDLALIGPDIEHVWEQNECKPGRIHEITIQFLPDTFPPNMLNKRYMHPLKEMLENAKVGIAFSMKGIMTVYDRLIKLSKNTKELILRQLQTW